MIWKLIETQKYMMSYMSRWVYECHKIIYIYMIEKMFLGTLNFLFVLVMKYK